MSWVPGSDLKPEQQAEVLSAFMYRYTVENDNWPAGRVTNVAPTEHDTAWLARHAFCMRHDGHLSMNVNHCEVLRGRNV